MWYYLSSSHQDFTWSPWLSNIIQNGTEETSNESMKNNHSTTSIKVPVILKNTNSILSVHTKNMDSGGSSWPTNYRQQCFLHNNKDNSLQTDNSTVPTVLQWWDLLFICVHVSVLFSLTTVSMKVLPSHFNCPLFMTMRSLFILVQKEHIKKIFKILEILLWEYIDDYTVLCNQNGSSREVLNKGLTLWYKANIIEFVTDIRFSSSHSYANKPLFHATQTHVMWKFPLCMDTGISISHLQYLSWLVQSLCLHAAQFLWDSALHRQQGSICPTAWFTSPK